VACWEWRCLGWFFVPKGQDSYGGAVITEAGTDSHVGALVYIAAHASEEGETEAANGKKFPNASKPLLKTADGFVFLRKGDPEQEMVIVL
jgi:hypothetical protein